MLRGSLERYKRTVRILSIDGGGIRGLIPALLLHELHRRVRLRRGGRARQVPYLYELFDLVAGTSTGALIALGLCAPAPAELCMTGRLEHDRGGEGRLLRGKAARGRRPAPDRAGARNSAHPAVSLERIIEIYTRYGIQVFPRWKFSRLRTVLQAFGEKYDAAPYERLLKILYGDLRVSDSLTNLLITSYDTERQTPFFFKRRPPHYQQPDDRDFLMRDAARASSAAPTFFEPAYIRPVDGHSREYFCLIDGAIFAANPAMAAYIEARKMYPWARRFVIVSLGTGKRARQFTYREMRNWGYIDWVSPIKGVPLSSMTTEAIAEAVNYQLYRLPGVEYYRFNALLQGSSEAMDDASEENMDALSAVARRIIDESSEQLNGAVSAML